MKSGLEVKINAEALRHDNPALTKNHSSFDLPDSSRRFFNAISKKIRKGNYIHDNKDQMLWI